MQNTLIACALLILAACGGGDGGGGGGGGLQAPTDLTYAENPATYTQGFAVSNAATVTGTVTVWDVAPALPGGLALDPADGTIAGTPLAPLAPTDFTVTASNAVGEAQAVVNIEVVIPAPRALYVANAADDTVTTLQIGSLVHAGYALSDGAGAAALAAAPDGATVYLANAASDDITLFAVDALSGRLTPSGSPVATGAGPSSIAVDPTGTFLYTGDLGDDTVSAFTIGAGGAPSAAALATTVAGSFLYVANAADATISQFSIDGATGALTPLAPATVATGLDPRDLAAHPDGTFLYCANHGDDTLEVYAIDPATGALTALPGGALAVGDGPSALAVDPRGTALYASTELDNEVSLLTLETDGSLTLVESLRARGAPGDLLLGPAEQAFVVQSEHAYVLAYNPANAVSQFALTAGALVALAPPSVATVSPTPRALALHPDQELVLVTADTGTSLSLFQRDGPTGLLTAAGSEAVTNSWDVAFEPSGRFAYVTLRLTGVQPFAVDVAAPDLSPLTLVAAGVDPRNLAVDPTGRFVYAAETTAGLFEYTIDPSTGELTPAGSAAGAGATAGVSVHPSGRYAYATNFSGNSISMYSIDPDSGALSARVPPAIATGSSSNPAGMAWSPDGNSLYVALSGTQQVAHFRVDKATGLLTFQSNHPTAAQSPQSLAVDATGTVLACTNSGSTGIVSLYTLNPATGAPTVSGFASAAAGGTTGVVFSRDVH